MMASQPLTANIIPTSWDWQPPSTYTKISTIDTHTGGEPLRIITSGLPAIYGSTVLQKQKYFKANYEHIRTGILLEPRGHADMYGAILTSSTDEHADLDVFFINTDGYSPMCGHAILAITKVVLETGVLVKEGIVRRVTMNTPAGLVHASASVVENKVLDIKFKNVASFAYLLDQKVQVEGIGVVNFDIGFGGAFYAVVNGDALGLQLERNSLVSLIDIGRRIKKAIVKSFKIEHPFQQDLGSLFGVLLTGKPHDAKNHSRNVNVFEDGEVDRSSTGTGVSARAALLVAKGELKPNEVITIESIVGSTMSVRAVETVKFGKYEAIVPEVGGEVSITGRHELFFHSKDPFGGGFMLRG